MPNGSGRSLYSWRAEVAQYADSWWQGSWDRSQPWDSPANKAIRDFPWRYCYDAFGKGDWQIPTKFSPETNMLAITGPGTAFGGPDEAPRSLGEIDRDTVLVVEVRNSGIHWMEPGDYDVRTMPHTINAKDGRGISSRYPGGFHVLFADEEVWFLSNKVPFELLARFFTVDGAKQFDREQVLTPFLIHRDQGSRDP